MSRLFFSLIALLFCQGVLAVTSCDSSFQELSESQLLELIAPLERGVLVRSAFKQERVMHLLKKPLLANGSMIFAPELGLYWQLDSPFNYQLIMTAEQFTQINGEQKQTINAADQPAMFAISKIFADLFAGDFVAAANYFSVKGKKSGSNKKEEWSLCLRPVQEPFNKLLAYIEIHGAKKINAVHIQDISDDYTHIEFLNPSLNSNKPLTDAEKSYFQKY